MVQTQNTTMQTTTKSYTVGTTPYTHPQPRGFDSPWRTTTPKRTTRKTKGRVQVRTRQRMHSLGVFAKNWTSNKNKAKTTKWTKRSNVGNGATPAKARKKKKKNTNQRSVRVWEQGRLSDTPTSTSVDTTQTQQNTHKTTNHTPGKTQPPRKTRRKQEQTKPRRKTTTQTPMGSISTREKLRLSIRLLDTLRSFRRLDVRALTVVDTNKHLFTTHSGHKQGLRTTKPQTHKTKTQTHRNKTGDNK